MAKRVIQLYDKYKSTTKVYPLIIGECLTDDAKETIKGLSPEVIANVTLAGTEAELTSLQIGDTKYKIGGGKQLYQHNIEISNIQGLSGTNIFLSIINSSNEAINDTTKMINAIKDKGKFICNGTYNSNNNLLYVFYNIVGSNDMVMIAYFNSGSISTNGYSGSASYTDTIITL